jgi:hypothetical protein
MILEALTAIVSLSSISLSSISLSSLGEIANSPFIVPVAGCAMIACIVIAGNAAGTRKRELESQERLAIAKGLVPPPTREELEITRARPMSNGDRRYGNIRLTGIILVSGAIGITAFFCILSWILGERDVLCGAACGLIPLGIGVGFLIDANLQKKNLSTPTTL